MLTISKVFTIVCLLCQCGNREVWLSKQISKLFLSNKFPSEVREKTFLKWTNIDFYPLNYLLHMVVMLSKLL